MADSFHDSLDLEEKRKPGKKGTRPVFCRKKCFNKQMDKACEANLSVHY